jgi:3-hydroxyacyl-CoA dehydrogenase/enoyl-CoA hydratase/3-hydroxybutyryl-CoA epimerase
MEQGNCRHWKTESDRDGTLRLILDRAGSGINSLSREVLEELDRLLDDIIRHNPEGVILCSGKTSGFIAGADVNEFSGVSEAAEALSHVERVHATLDRLERLPFPTVCVIRGFCLGGGLELALACRHRIAVDSPETVLGLPEVKLGIHPGFGGTVRLIRQAGALPALELMLSGRSVDARRALELGLVDYAVPERQWRRAAQTVLRNPPPRKKPGLHNSLWRLRPGRALLARYLRKKIAGRASRKHYPAPYALIDLWERFGGDPGSMDREEARSVADLVTRDTARNLVRVFRLQERLRNREHRQAYDFRSVHVIGAGTMGGDIASWCALQGFRVSLQDVDLQRLASAVKRASVLFHKKLRKPRLVEAAMDRFIPDPAGKGAERADVVIEAIFEDVSAKSDLYRQVEPRMRKDALLATNTSSIPLEELYRPLRHPERFVGLHFFNPVARMQLVEVVRGKEADPDSLDRAAGFVSAIRRLPLPVSSAPGFLVNRILTPYLLEAMMMEQEGIPPEEIDRAAVDFGMPMGPMLLADTVGLDICLSAGKILSGALKQEVPKKLENLVAMGRLGKKSSQGFYRYKKGKAVASKKNTGAPLNPDLEDRLILRLLNEAVACRREGVVSDGNLLDAGAVFGIGFAPFRGGPVHYIRSSGIDSMLDRLRTLESRYGSRFTPDPGWHNLKMPEPDRL